MNMIAVEARMRILSLILVAVVCTVACRTSVPHSQCTSLVESSDVIILAEILSQDRRLTESDGPLITDAKILRVLKGAVSEGLRIRFCQGCMVEPCHDFKVPGKRVLLLQRIPNSTAYDGGCKFHLPNSLPDMIISNEELASLSLDSLRARLMK